jgi:hypothetical protein
VRCIGSAMMGPTVPLAHVPALRCVHDGRPADPGPARCGTTRAPFRAANGTEALGTQPAALACMARLLAFGVALVGLVSVFAGGAGCTSTGSNQGAADAAAMTPDGQGGVSDDAPIDASSSGDGGCVVPTLGAMCTTDETPCPQPIDRCCVGYDWFCNAISHSWQKGFLGCPPPPSCGDGGTAAADAATDSGGADADACATPVVCGEACISGAHNISTMVGGCLVTRCCVPADAGTE